MVHILQVDCNHNHAHGKADAKLSHTLCIEPESEEQTQQYFDTADPDTGFCTYTSNLVFPVLHQNLSRPLGSNITP